MHRHIKCLLLAAMLSAFWTALAANDKKTIDLPRGTVEGFLDNGLHYIIMPNSHPRHGVEMRLVMKVGSLQETEQQKGGAHFLEHMAFAGTTHFPDNSWVDYFERLGMKYGRDINAFTGFDRTIYWLSLPVADMGTQVMNSTLLAMRDILDGLSLHARRIESERGVIKEELRSYSTGDDFYNLKIGTGRYPKRMPLGSEADISTITRLELSRYYNLWYQPKNATLVVVGDIDVNDLQQRIRNVFGQVTAKESLPVQQWPLEYNRGLTLSEITDTLSNKSKLEFIIPHKCVVANTIATHALKEQYRLLAIALSKTLAARGMKASVSDTWYLADKNHFAITVEGVNKRDLKKKMNQTIGVISKIADMGFYTKELADYTKDFVASMKVDTLGTSSSQWCDDFIDYVIAGDRHVTSRQDLESIKAIVANTNNEVMQKLLKGIINDAKQTILVAYRNNVGKTSSFNPRDLKKLWQHGLKAKTPGYTYKPRVEEEPEEVKIPDILTQTHDDANASVKTVTNYSDLGATAYQLDNGLRIVLRPTTDKDSTLFLTMIGRGGVGDIDARHYPMLKDAVSYVDMGGLKHADPEMLVNAMQHDDLSMTVGIDDYWHEVLASGRVDKPQELMNLVYEKVTAPRLAYEDFEDVRSSERENFGTESLLDKLLKRDMDRMLSRRLDSLMCNIPANNSAKMTREDIDKLNLDSMAVYYKSVFANPKQTTLILTGNFNPATVLNAATSTFARLKDKWHNVYHDVPSHMPAAPYKEGFTNEVDSQTVLNYIFPGNYKPSLRQSLTLKLMRDVLQARLLSVLREQMNIVYSPYADLYYSGSPQQKYYFWLTVAVKEANRERADQALRDIIADLHENCIGETDLKKLKMSFLVTKRKALSDDAPVEWKKALTDLVRNGETLEDYNNYTECLGGITPEDIRQAFRQYVRTDNMTLLYKGNKF